MALYRGSGGSGNATDDSIVADVTAQASIAATKKTETQELRNEVETFKESASTSASTATAKATQAGDYASAAQTVYNDVVDAVSTVTAASNSANASKLAAQSAATAANCSAVTTVAGSNTQVVGVYNDIANVNTVAEDIDDVNTVAGISSDVTTVAADASDIGTVATNITDVTKVADNNDNVTTVAGLEATMDALIGGASSFIAVENKLDDIETLAPIASNITTVAGLESKMDTVIADASDIGDVAGNIDDVSTVAGLNGNVTKVADIDDKVITVADNISSVQGASSNATNASISATQASNSATSATSSANSASTSADEAEVSAASASASALASSSDRTDAQNAALVALQKSYACSNSASTADTKAEEASGYATDALTSHNLAEASRRAAELAQQASINWNTFYHQHYLGGKSSAPNLDVGGNALTKGALYFNTTDDTMYVYNGSTWVAAESTINNVNWGANLAANLNTNGYDISFGDNDKAMFGAGNDLQIWHDGSNSRIKDSGTGDLFIQGSTNVQIEDASGANMIFATSGGSVKLFHNALQKLATTATGIGVTGTVTVGHATATNEQLRLGSYTSSSHPDLNSITQGSAFGGLIESGTKGHVIVGIRENDGYDSFSVVSGGAVSGNTYSDNSTYDKLCFQVKAGGDAFVNGNLGIGTSSPVAVLDVECAGGSGGRVRFGGTTTSAYSTHINVTNTGMELWAQSSVRGITFSTGTTQTERMRIDSSGNVGIGTSSPKQQLHISGGTASGDVTKVTIGATGNNAESHLQLAERFTGNEMNYGFSFITDGTDTNNLLIKNHNNSTSGDVAMSIARGTGNVGIGTTSPNSLLHLKSSSDVKLTLETDEGSDCWINFSGSTSEASIGYEPTNNALVFANAGDGLTSNERMRIDLSGNVLVGTTSIVPQEGDHGFVARANGYTIVSVDDARPMLINRATSDGDLIQFRKDNSMTPVGSIGTRGGAVYLSAGSAGGIRTTFANSTNGVIQPCDTSGNLADAVHDLGQSNGRFKDLYLSGTAYAGNAWVGKTASSLDTTGIQLQNDGLLRATRDGNEVLQLNRKSSDGAVANFYKDGTTVGSIGVSSSNNLTVGSSASGHAGFELGNQYLPLNGGSASNGELDLGSSSRRFKDLYRSGSTYSTSDRNKKQDIRDLTDAEARVAVVAKGSLKAFRYIDTVEAEGDEANIHFGIIAQDLKAAFEAEGLNANNYQVLKTTTYTDDDGVEQTTYSVCYENLLAFIIAAV